jgi:hypothetical protein
MADEFQPDDQHGAEQEFLYELIGFNDNPTDPTMHDLFWDVMYNDELSYDQRVDIYEQLSLYLYESYGLNFEELWDWEDFREWYKNA